VILRRRRLPPDLQPAFDAFAGVVGDVERGKEALTTSVPGTRFAGRPLLETLLEFDEALGAAQEGMAAWRRPEVEDAWRAADSGLRQARALASRLRTEGPDPAGFEGVIGLIGDLLAPLEPFIDAREAFRRLRA
jgi:hypothetical protein